MELQNSVRNLDVHMHTCNKAMKCLIFNTFQLELYKALNDSTATVKKSSYVKSSLLINKQFTSKAKSRISALATNKQLTSSVTELQSITHYMRSKLFTLRWRGQVFLRVKPNSFYKTYRKPFLYLLYKRRLFQLCSSSHLLMTVVS